MCGVKMAMRVAAVKILIWRGGQFISVIATGMKWWLQVLLTLGAHAQRGLRYLVMCVSVC